MEENNIDFNTKLKNISKDLVASFFKSDNTQSNNTINNINQSNQSSHNIDQNFSYTEVIYHKAKDLSQFTTKKNKNKNLANSYKRLLFTEQTTKSSVTNNYIPQNGKNQISSLKTKTDNKIKPKKYKLNLDLSKTFTSSEIYNNFKAKQESKREKKLYEDKIQALKNHINALKKQQSDLTKKAEKAKENEKYKMKLKQEKESIKQALLSAEIDRRNEMEMKRKNIAEKKMKEENGILISKRRNNKDKKNEYKKLIIHKKKLKKIVNEDNYKSNEINRIIIDKIKRDREKTINNLYQKKKNYINKVNNSYRITYQNNLNETKKLKNELIKLEEIENQYLQNMKYTQDTLKNYNKNNIKYRMHQKIKSDYSLDDIDNMKIKENKRKANSVMKRYKINNKNNISRNKRNKNKSCPKIKND